MGEHTNTFQRGMVRDPNIIYQPDGTYRYAKNVQIISQDGNNWVIKDALGNTKIFDINIPYEAYTAGPGGGLTYQIPPIIIGFISFPDKLIVFSTNDNTEVGGYGEIGILTYATYGEGIQPQNLNTQTTYTGYLPLYHHVDLNFTKQRLIEGFAFDESETHQRVYWTDDLNEPRVLDVGDPIYTTYYASGSLSVGTQYMVLEGVITHNGINYGPGLGTGNVFTAVNANYTDIGIPVAARVIKYYPIELLAFNPSRALGNIKFKEFLTGSVYCGAKIYFYRLVDTANGIFTSWSYGSFIVQVGADNSVGSSPSNSYFDYVGGGDTATLLNSGRRVRMDISNIDTNFTRIQMACAEFDQAVDVPRLISIVDDQIITGTSMTLEHTGNVNLGTLTINDITLFPASILKCKTMTTNKGYNLIGNITEREEFDFDTSAITLAEIHNIFPVHPATELSCPNVLTYQDSSPDPSTNPSFIAWGVQFQVTSIAGGNVTYNAVSYGLGAVFTGVQNVSAITIPAGSQVRPCVYKNKYTTTGGTDRPDVTLFTAGESFWSYKNPAMVHNKLGYWADEKYRFGIMFYDLKGNPFYVRWINDFTFSTLTTNELTARHSPADFPANYDSWFLRQRGVRLSAITIPAADIDKISGFSIVRSQRDKRIITEGLLTQVGLQGSNIGGAAGPEKGTNHYLGTATNYYLYLCPDALVGFPMTNYGAGSQLEGGVFLHPPNYTAGVNMKTVDVSYQMETRWMGQEASDGITRRSTIRNSSTINEAQSLTNFGSNNYILDGFVEAQLVPPSLIDNSCVGGAAVLASKKGVAGRRTILETIEAIPDYTTPFITYSDLVAPTNAGKLLIDTTVVNTNQYGGTSETALANTLYISIGHFQPITTAVKNDTLDGGGNYTFNNIDIWGGDCYTNLIDYGYALFDSSFGNPYSWGIKFPCQNNSNYDLRRGRTVANNKMYQGVPTNGVYYNDAGTSNLESFDYNEAYSTLGIAFQYPALPANFAFENIFKYRVRFAGLKNPNEVVNSFRQFFVADFKDLDGQGGEINNIRTKNARVVVWQNLITSTVPVLERQILSGLSGAPTTLGTGGVVDRYDPLTSYFGNQHQHGLITTEYGFSWFDMRRKAFMVMDMSAGGIIEVSAIEGMKGFFDEIFIDNVGVAVWTEQINSPLFLEISDRPLRDTGIIGVYDPKFKMTYMTFKFLNHVDGDQNIVLAKDFTIGYYHPSKCFVGFFDWTPGTVHNHNQIVLSTNLPLNKTVYYGPGMNASSYVIGNVVAYDYSEWICIQNVSVASFRADVTKEPGSAGAAYWTLVNKMNNVWVHNQPTTLGQTIAPDYLYNKFFGIVVDNEIEFIVNPKTPNPFSVNHIEQIGNNAMPTSVYIDAGTQSASDIGITSTNRSYRYIWDRICSNLPFSSTGRIVNNYLKIKLVKRNWTSPSPTVVTGVTKILEQVKSAFIQKR